MRENTIVAMLKWHFIEVPKFLLELTGNYFSFGLHYFSIPTLLATLVSPWRHYRSFYPRGFNLGEYLATFTYNTFSRFMGLLCRLILIALGVVFQVLVCIIGIAVFKSTES